MRRADAAAGGRSAAAAAAVRERAEPRAQRNMVRTLTASPPDAAVMAMAAAFRDGGIARRVAKRSL